MGMPLLDGIRQMAMTATDPHSMGRNFASHFARRDWNVLPGHFGDRGAVRHGARHRPGAEALRRRRHHHRHRRRRRHGRGRFRLVPDLEHAAGQRAAGAHHRDEQRLGHLDPGAPASTARSTSSTAARRSAFPARSSTATTRSRAGTPSAGPWPTAAASAGPSCWRRWCRGCTAIRRRAAPPCVKDEPDCIDAVRAEAARRRRPRPGHGRADPRGGLRRGGGGRWSRRCREARADGGRRGHAHLRPQPGGCGLPGGLHGTAAGLSRAAT